MDIRDAVFDFLDSGGTCVLPTETAARFYLQEYARFSRKGMVFARSAIAWDEFYKLFLPSHGDLKPSDGLVRRLFARSFAASGQAGHLRHWRGLSVENLASSIFRILPYLELASGHSGGDIGSDAAVILSGYRAFLEERGMFEPLYDRPSVPDGMDCSGFVICFPEAMDGYPLFAHFVGEGRFRTIGASDVTVKPVIEMFGNSLLEMRVQLRRIRRLLDEGVNASDIMLTDFGLPASKAYLDREARRLEIPLDFTENLPLAFYSAGRFFLDVQSVLSEDFSIQSMQRLLLSGSYPFRNKKVLRSIIAAGLQKMVVSGREEWEARLRGEERAEFVRLVNLLEGFRRCRSAEDMRKALNAFQDELFIPGAFNQASEPEMSVYSFCVRQISRIEEAMAACRMESVDGLFGFFVKLLETTPYVPQDREQGIAVYSNGPSAGLFPEHHFVIGVSQASARHQVRVIPFLPESERGDFFLDPIERTDDLLRLWCASGADVRISGADSGFDGAQLCPPFFLSCDGRRRYAGGNDSDEYNDELGLWSGLDAPLSLNQRQKDGFRTFKDCFLDEVEFGALELPDELPKLSPTSIDSYNQCPFQWKCKYILGVDEGNYNMGLEDHPALGILVHDTMERFFMDAGVIDASQRERYAARLLRIFNEEFERFAPGSGMSETTLQYEKRVLRDCLKQELDYSMMNGYRAVAAERALENADVRGKIDLVMQDSDGRLAVIDIKKGSLKSQKDSIFWEDMKESGIGSVQILAYNRLLESSDGHLAAWGAFLSLKDGRLYFGWSDEAQAMEADKLFEANLQAVKSGIREGRFDPVDNCDSCAYFQACRKRYVIR